GDFLWRKHERPPFDLAKLAAYSACPATLSMAVYDVRSREDANPRMTTALARGPRLEEAARRPRPGETRMAEQTSDTTREDSLLRRAGIALDSEKHEVICRGHPATLTKREFQVLRVLMEADGRILDAAAIRVAAF